MNIKHHRDGRLYAPLFNLCSPARLPLGKHFAENALLLAPVVVLLFLADAEYIWQAGGRSKT